MYMTLYMYSSCFCACTLHYMYMKQKPGLWTVEWTTLDWAMTNEWVQSSILYMH